MAYPSRFFPALVRSLAGVLLCASVLAEPDADIEADHQARRSLVQPMCPSLSKHKGKLAPQQRFHKGLCQLYGIGTPVNRDAALPLLREAAGQQIDGAALAVADTLQAGDNWEQQEALQWYAKAGAAGDEKATSRHAWLLQRMEASIHLPMPAAKPPDDGAPEPVLPRGYHCHVLGFGKRFCHSALD
ncbi:hypothetical protein [Chitinimonas sp.]|uniref:hypothetical protein n=1 Tax=Chitinimonas sp. TaxID=1934313 RepID=UPI002F93A6DC